MENDKAIWDVVQVNIFVDIFLEEIAANDRLLCNCRLDILSS